MKRIFFCALALSLALVHGRAQLPSIEGGGGGAPGSDFAVLSKLFSKVGAFSAKSQVRVLDKNQKEAISVPMDFAMLDKNLRMEIDAAKMKNKDLAVGTIDALQQMGLDKFVTLIRPDRKTLHVIYPKAACYLTLPMKPEELQAGDKSSMKTEVIGRETLDGHPCLKNKITITPPKGGPQIFTVWNATDLKDFPIQTLTRQDTDTIITRYTNVQLLKPDAKQFEPPAGFEEFKGLAAFQAGMMKRSQRGATPAAK
jgi:hypothetical protein